jgi:signal transduction histidine kinase
LDASKQLTGVVVVFRDVSQERQEEQQRAEFISTASHEMRTPVAAIEGYLSLAMNPNVATIDERAKKYLEKAHDSISHLGELFRDLLSVTKAEEGSLNVKIEPVNLAKVMQAATEDMQVAASKKNLTIVYQIGDQQGKAISPLYYVGANPERLREILLNLIDNAIKFTTEGGIKVTLNGDDKEVQIGVQDTGVGIDPADIPHLFQKFYRIDSSDTRTIGGTGLGLYLCRRAIELFNGRIWVESKPGEGSTFRFALPRLSQEDVERMQASLPQTQKESQDAPPLKIEETEAPPAAEYASEPENAGEAIGGQTPQLLQAKPRMAPSAGAKTLDSLSGPAGAKARDDNPTIAPL